MRRWSSLSDSNSASKCEPRITDVEASSVYHRVIAKGNFRNNRDAKKLSPILRGSTKIK